MRRKKQQDCAVTDSVSQEPTTTNKEENAILQESAPETENVVSPEPTSEITDAGNSQNCVESEEMNEEEQLAVARQLISDFARQCIVMPDCKANALRALRANYMVNDDIRAHQINMSNTQILKDARNIFKTMEKLADNYSKEHDHANKVLDLNARPKSTSLSVNASNLTDTVSTPSVAMARAPSASPTNRMERYNSTGLVWQTTLPSTRRASFNTRFSTLIFTSCRLGVKH